MNDCRSNVLPGNLNAKYVNALINSTARCKINHEALRRLKWDFHLPKKFFLLASMKDEGPLEMMKNVFYFMLKALFVRGIYLHFCLDFLAMQKNGLIRKLMSKFMTSQIGQQIIATHILHNISRSKGNQTMKFGQLTECNLRNIFF